MEEPEPTFPQMDTFATIASVIGGGVALFGLFLALKIADAAGDEWTVMSFGALLGGVASGLLIILLAQALHVLVALEENTREILDNIVDEAGNG